MKKFIVALLTLIASTAFFAMVNAESGVATEDIYIHYFRYASDYDNWGVWVWEVEPDDLEGETYSFTTDDTDSAYNFGGVVTHISISESFPGATKFGLIVKLGNWEQKDIATDRKVEIPETTDNGELHIYLVEGDTRVGTSPDDPNGPTTNPKFLSAFFSELNEIYFKATETLSSDDIAVKANGIEVGINNIEIDGTTGTIYLVDEIDFSQKYTVEASFPSDSSVNDYSVTFDGVYDSDEFVETFTYTGDDLGAYPSAEKTTFRIWAPISEQVVLNLYTTGTPSNLGGTDTPYKTVTMTPDVKGTFYCEEAGNLHGVYYTYSVTNGTMTSEVVDPYAKGVGINGVRGLVVDFSQTNPDGYTYDTRADNMENVTDAVIYELHVRDLTSDSTWNGSEANRAKYLGLVESGTTYEGVSTGFDHITDLGVTHVQLLPFFDFGTLDESQVNDEDYQAFNWGYMPINYNALEGSYSSDPYDGLVRITEMKEVVMAFTAADIRVNMDVVYNHSGLTADSNFELIVPGYYFRKTAAGEFSNGSGCGNETASERSMMRKFIIESCVFWATEYNLSGFRFDLMALEDIDTMNMVADALHEIDPTIMVYGEPWTGGTTVLSESLKSGKSNLYELPTIAAFNDDFRDAVKGTIWIGEQGGYVQGYFTAQIMNRLKYGIVGGIAYPGIDVSQLSVFKAWHTSPTKTINYVTCHDNNTLYDKLYMTLEESKDLDLISTLDKQAYALVMTSQGITFIHAGDEILRSKPLDDGSGFDSNSYTSPDSVNSIKWDQKADETGYGVFEYYQGLIALRKAHSSFRMTSADDVINNLTFVYDNVEGVVAYTITNGASNDEFDTIMVINNANEKAVKLELSGEEYWYLVIDGNIAGDEVLAAFSGGTTIKISAHSSCVLFQDSDPVQLPSETVKGLTVSVYNPLPVIIASITGGVLLLAGAGVFIVLKLRKRPEA